MGGLWKGRGRGMILPVRLDRRSMYLAVNNTDAHRYFAMMLAVERKAQRRAYV